MAADKACRVSEKQLIEEVKALRDGELRKQIEARLGEFRALRKAPSGELFNELCFCLLTANFNAERAIAIQKEIGDGFEKLPQAKLSAELKRLGYRYPNARAAYIVEARKHKGELKSKLDSLSEPQLRAWLVDNIKGLGMKEASHFLRNVGFGGCAIIDFHIVDLLEGCKIVQKPKTITAKHYVTIEEELKRLGKALNMNMAELDLYLWYLETGKVLK